MRRKISFLVIIALVSMILLCSGCWDVRELDTISLVTGIGIDTSEAENECLYTFQLFKPQNASGGASMKQKPQSEEKSFTVLENSNIGVLAAVNSLRKSNTRDIFLDHNQVLVVGREKAEQGFLQELDVFIRSREMRMETWMMIADGTAGEILRTTIVQEKNPSLGLSRMMYDEQYFTDSFSITLLNYVSKVEEETTAPVLPIISIDDLGEKEMVYKIKGMAVLKNNKLIGEMDIDLVRGYGWGNGDYKRTYFDVGNEFGNVTVIIHNIKCNSKAVISEDGKPGMELELKGIFELTEIMGFKNMTPQEIVPIIEKMVNESIVEKVEKTLTYSQTINADIFGIGNKIYRAYPKKWEKMQNKWDSLYPQSFINTSTNFKLHNVGKSDKSLEMEKL